MNSLQGGAAFALPAQQDLLRQYGNPQQDSGASFGIGRAGRAWCGALGPAAVARRGEISMSMKQKKARKAAGARSRRAGPRTDVEGYSHANFREFFLSNCLSSCALVGKPRAEKL